VRISEGEYNSEGFATEGLDPYERCPAGLACHYTNPSGVRQEYPHMYFSGSYPLPVRAVFEGVEDPYRSECNSCPLVNNTSGSVVGYKYFNFDVLGQHGSSVLMLSHIPEGVEGRMDIFVDSPSTENGGIRIGCLDFDGTCCGKETTSTIKVKNLKGLKGKHSLYFVFSSNIPGRSICRLNEFRFLNRGK